jgi:NAD(P)-dependent dehydrogenase (short-subunit alcohol dehydrogenase family)
MATVLVTGCGSGIGRVTATRLFELGHDVYAGVRKADQVAARSVGPDGRGSLRWVLLDVTAPDQVEAAVSGLKQEFGHVDAVVNNAGQSMFAALEETSDEDIRAILDSNLLGPFRVARAALPIMRDQGAGVIINVSSLAGFAPQAYLGAYTGSKAALDAMSFCLAAEVREFGIRVIVVSPGSFTTESHNKRRPPSLDAGVPRYRAVMQAKKGRSIKLKTDRHPITIADAIADLIVSDVAPARVFIGEDAQRMAAERHGFSDEEYIAMMSEGIAAF